MLETSSLLNASEPFNPQQFHQIPAFPVYPYAPYAIPEPLPRALPPPANPPIQGYQCMQCAESIAVPKLHYSTSQLGILKHFRDVHKTSPPSCNSDHSIKQVTIQLIYYTTGTLGYYQVNPNCHVPLDFASTAFSSDYLAPCSPSPSPPVPSTSQLLQQLDTSEFLQNVHTQINQVITSYIPQVCHLKKSSLHVYCYLLAYKLTLLTYLTYFI